MIIFAQHFVGEDERYPRNENMIPRIAEVARIVPTDVVDAGGDALGVRLMAIGSDGDGEAFTLNISPVMSPDEADRMAEVLFGEAAANGGAIDVASYLKKYHMAEVEAYNKARAVKRASAARDLDEE